MFFRVLYVSLCLSNTATGTLLSRSLTPDDDVFQHLAYTYASRNPNMTKGDQCKNKRHFPNGITNGYSWYPLQGELVFPSFACALCLEVPASVKRALRHNAVPQSGLHPRISRECGGDLEFWRMWRYAPHSHGLLHSLRHSFLDSALPESRNNAKKHERPCALQGMNIRNWVTVP